MKKILISFIIVILLITGCKNNKEEKITIDNVNVTENDVTFDINIVKSNSLCWIIFFFFFCIRQYHTQIISLFFFLSNSCSCHFSFMVQYIG